MIKGIHHVSALTKSFNENHRFYSEILGLRLVKIQSTKTISICATYFMAIISVPGTLLTFFEVPRIGSSYDERAFLAISP